MTTETRRTRAWGVSDVAYFVLLSVAPGLAYQYIQDNLRRDPGAPELVAYGLGVAPNFLGAVSLASVLFLLGLERFPGAPVRNIAVGAAATGFVGLAAWEFAQKLTPNGVFDWHDLFWTAPGVFIFLTVTRIWYANRWKD